MPSLSLNNVVAVPSLKSSLSAKSTTFTTPKRLSLTLNNSLFSPNGNGNLPTNRTARRNQIQSDLKKSKLSLPVSRNLRSSFSSLLSPSKTPLPSSSAGFFKTNASVPNVFHRQSTYMSIKLVSTRYDLSNLQFIVILRNSLIGSESNRSTYSNNEDERPAELISSELGETIWTRANENFSILERFSKLAVSVGVTLVSRDLSAMSHGIGLNPTYYCASNN